MSATPTMTNGACDLQAPKRNHYFHGKLLDVYHFELETAYLNFKRRMLNRLVTGYGVVCGLNVKAHPHCEDAITVCPGFDDSHLTAEHRQDKEIRRITRRGTKTYEYMQEAALGLYPPPDYVVITSFNEYHENTHIEPSKKFGDLFLRSTRTFKEQLHE